MKKGRKKVRINHTAWIINQFDVLVFCLGRFWQQTYIHTCSAEVTARGFSPDSAPSYPILILADAGRRIKFAPEKVLILGIFSSEF